MRGALIAFGSAVALLGCPPRAVLFVSDASGTDTAEDTVSTDTATIADAPTCGNATTGCDPVTLQGCTLTDPNCDVVVDGTGMGLEGACVPAGRSGPGATCSLTSDCAMGLVCLQGMTTGAFACRRLCCMGDDAWCQTAPAPVPGTLCTGRIHAPSGGSTPYGYCE